jgi:gluconate 2-dehydrogenase gamma chain
MNPSPENTHSRREFLRTVTVAAGIVSVPPVVRAEVSEATTGSVAPIPVYLALSPDEAAFVETLVDVMCPADEYTPGGVECGLATFIDRQIAGGFGKGERLYRKGPWRTGRPEDGYQLPLTPEQYFKEGLRAADQACARRYQRGFSELNADEAEVFLTDLAEDRLIDAPLKLADWFNELVYPLFIQACFADPVYGGNHDKVFWKMIGYPGLPAVNGLNMVKYRGKPFPGSRAPKSMEDFS